MRVCRDLPAGFVGIGSEKSVDVAVRDRTPLYWRPGGEAIQLIYTDSHKKCKVFK